MLDGVSGSVRCFAAASLVRLSLLLSRALLRLTTCTRLNAALVTPARSQPLPSSDPSFLNPPISSDAVTVLARSVERLRCAALSPHPLPPFLPLPCACHLGGCTGCRHSSLLPFHQPYSTLNRHCSCHVLLVLPAVCHLSPSPSPVPRPHWPPLPWSTSTQPGLDRRRWWRRVRRRCPLLLCH